MDYEKGQLGLITPKAIVNPSFIIDLKQAKAWRKSLHMHDLKATVKSTDVFLKNLSQTTVSATQKLDILNLVSPIVSLLCESIAELYPTKPQEITAKNQLFHIILSLQLELFNQFKFALEQALQSAQSENTAHAVDTTQLDNALQANLTFACIQQSCNILFLCYKVNQPAPKFIWLETHILYLFGKKTGFSLKNMSAIQHSHSQFKSIADIYKHILIFALTNPLGFDESEMLKLYFATEAWAPLLNLYTASQNNTALFKIDFSKDAPPHYSALDNSTEQNTHYLRLDRILEHIDLLFLHSDNPEKTVPPILTAHELTLGPDILQSLKHTWKHYGQRHNSREQMTGTRTVAIGLRAIHWFATQVQNELGDKQNVSSQMLSNKDEQNIEEIVLDEFSLPEELKEQQSVNTAPSTMECEIIDKSDNGYCLKWQQHHGGQLKSNELVGILQKNDTEDPCWQLAIIRWLQQSNPNHKLMGVEILALQVTPVTLQSSHQTNTQTNALLVTEFLTNQCESMLITPNLIYEAKEQLHVTAQEKKYNACLVRNISISPLYAFWEIALDQPLLQQQSPVHTQPPPAEENPNSL